MSVQFEYATFPVWAEVDGRVIDDEGPLNLPIDASLREDLRTWSADMSREMAPRSSNVDRINELNDRGLELANRLRRELGAGYSVQYYDEVLGSFRQLD